MDITIVYLSVSPYSRPPLLSTYYIYYIHQKEFLLSFFSSPFFLFFCLFRNGPPGPDDTARPWKRRQAVTVTVFFFRYVYIYIYVCMHQKHVRTLSITHGTNTSAPEGGLEEERYLLIETLRVSLTEEGMYV